MVKRVLSKNCLHITKRFPHCVIVSITIPSTSPASPWHPQVYLIKPFQALFVFGCSLSSPRGHTMNSHNKSSSDGIYNRHGFDLTRHLPLRQYLSGSFRRLEHLICLFPDIECFFQMLQSLLFLSHFIINKSNFVMRFWIEWFNL